MSKMDEVKALRLAREARAEAKRAAGRRFARAVRVAEREGRDGSRGKGSVSASKASAGAAVGKGGGGARRVSAASGELPGREDMRTEVSLRRKTGRPASPVTRKMVLRATSAAGAAAAGAGSKFDMDAVDAKLARARQSTSEGLVPRVIKLPAALWEKIDGYRSEKKMPTRTAAIRELLEYALS